MELLHEHFPGESREDYFIGELSIYLSGEEADDRWIEIVNEVLTEKNKQETLELYCGNEYVDLDTEFLQLRKEKYDEMVSELFHPDEIKDGVFDDEDINQKLEEEIRDIEDSIEIRVLNLIEEEAEKREKEEEMED